MSYINLVPAGAVMAFAGATAPKGYLLCNGSAVSRTTYAELFSVIGTAHGSGDGSTTFNLPDYRGQFLRGVDGGAGRDPNTSSRTAMNTGGNTGDAVGSVQGNATAVNGLHDAGHSHGSQGSGYLMYTTGGGFSSGSSGNQANTIPNTNASTASLAGDSETRPINAYVNYIIKS